MGNPYQYSPAQQKHINPYEQAQKNRNFMEQNTANNQNVVSAILTLMKDLNKTELNYLRKEIENKISKKQFFIK